MIVLAGFFLFRTLSLLLDRHLADFRLNNYCNQLRPAVRDCLYLDLHVKFMRKGPVLIARATKSSQPFGDHDLAFL